jgi:hypothetical protein
MNHASSRSHAIFTIVVESECKSGNKTIARSGKVNLVDLAGSERLYKVCLLCRVVLCRILLLLSRIALLLDDMHCIRLRTARQ